MRIKIVVALATSLLVLLAHSVAVFAEDVSEDSDGAVVFDPDCCEDSTGNIEDSDGTKWNKGADGHYRSDSGGDCYYSKPLDKMICEE